MQVHVSHSVCAVWKMFGECDSWENSRGAKKIISLDARAGAILEISYKMLISETLRGEGGTSGV